MNALPASPADRALVHDLAGRLRRFARPGVPKYVALSDAVLDAVNRDEWPPGARLPNESALAADLPLSLGTIQRGLRLLVESRVIVRRQGQGTFVARNRRAELK